MEKAQTYTITVESENKPGVLYRISGIFLKRKINVESLFVKETKRKGISSFIISVNTTEYSIKRILSLIRKIVEVKNASIFSRNGETDHWTESLEVSAIKQVEFLAKTTKNTVSLAQGIPSFFTPSHIREAAKSAIDQNLVDKYTSGYGIEELRVAIANKLQNQNRIEADASQIIVTHGAIEATMSVFMALLNPGDNLIMITPNYASHTAQAQIALRGIKPIFVPLNETKEGWILDPQKLEKAINPQVKAIVICNPCNPTGKVYTEKELKEIARIAKKYNLYIISDEMYEDFVYGERKHISIGSFKEVKERVISIFGFSKSYAMTGWRIGYITASKKLVPRIYKIHDALVTCPTVISQYAALSALKGNKNSVSGFKEAFEKRKQMVLSILSKTDKLEFVEPAGAYYVFPKFVKAVDDQKLSTQLVKKAGVAVVPGRAFGAGGENHIRICFAVGEESLMEGTERFVRYIEKMY